jgi:uncharacterized cofD-like protein
VSHVETIPFPLRVVALGGGTGLPAVLRGLKAVLFPAGLADDSERLTAVVTVTDEGGSSGRLRESLRMLPPGDIRNCLVALSHNEPLMARLFQARYRNGDDLEGHPVGNLILAALAQEESGGFLAAVQLASEVLNIQGRVFPSTLEQVRLAATMTDGRELLGETALAAAGGAVRRLRLEPPADAAAPGVVEAIEAADLVILGPGSLFSSIVPNLLVGRLADALRRTRALRLLVVNAMTEEGETNGFTAAAHVRAVLDHAGTLDGALLATDVVPDEILARYREEGAERVADDGAALDRLVPFVVRRPLMQVRPKVRHDALLTAGAVLEALVQFRRAGGRSALAERTAERKAV